MEEFDARQALETFLRNRRAGTFFPKEWEGSLLLEEAYAVQLALVQHHALEGRRQVGWKVGLTARPIQEQFSVHEPGFGFLRDDGLHSSGDAIPHDSLIGPGFENELCVTMGTDLTWPGRARRAPMLKRRLRRSHQRSSWWKLEVISRVIWRWWCLTTFSRRV
ncbi:MAG: hypothetical protein O2826_11375 [Chloroflexi bacterium]|nr:hypothetical protein [Chloroflexota bacterium]MDA1175100.1 hypothetical protein [Chloroflexota bacterium]